MAPQKKKETVSTDIISRDILPKGVIIAVFALILIAYLVTLTVLFPAMPVIARQAENIPGYDTHYPPFRVDEYNYNTIAHNILSGSIYTSDSLERSYTIGFPVVAAPFIALFGDIGGYIANTLIIWAGLIIFYCIARRFAGSGLSIVATLILAFTTLDYFYAASCYTEPLAQLMVLLSIFFILPRKGKESDVRAFIVSGVFVALNLFIRPHYILLAAPFVLYLFFNEQGHISVTKKPLFFAIGAGAVGVLWMIRNTAVFGGPLTFEYSRLMNSYIPGAASSYMKGNIFLGSHSLFFDQYHGLFTITPILLLFPAGLRNMYLNGKKTESLMLLTAVALMAVFAAASAYPFTEFGLGSRHMLPVMPLMVLPLVFFLDSRLFSRSVVVVLALYSFYHAGIGWYTGGEPGVGMFIGILNEAQSRAVILARKGMLPEKKFSSREELVEAYLSALKEANLLKLLQTMDPLVIEKIRGNERTFMLFLRSRPNPVEFILSADPARGIIIKSFSLSGGGTPPAAPEADTQK